MGTKIKPNRGPGRTRGTIGGVSIVAVEKKKSRKQGSAKGSGGTKSPVAGKEKPPKKKTDYKARFDERYDEHHLDGVFGSFGSAAKRARSVRRWEKSMVGWGAFDLDDEYFRSRNIAQHIIPALDLIKKHAKKGKNGGKGFLNGMKVYGTLRKVYFAQCSILFKDKFRIRVGSKQGKGTVTDAHVPTMKNIDAKYADSKTLLNVVGQKEKQKEKLQEEFYEAFMNKSAEQSQLKKKLEEVDHWLESASFLGGVRAELAFGRWRPKLTEMWLSKHLKNKRDTLALTMVHEGWHAYNHSFRGIKFQNDLKQLTTELLKRSPNAKKKYKTAAKLRDVIGHLHNEKTQYRIVDEGLAYLIELDFYRRLRVSNPLVDKTEEVLRKNVLSFINQAGWGRRPQP